MDAIGAASAARCPECNCIEGTRHFMNCSRRPDAQQEQAEYDKAWDRYMLKEDDDTINSPEHYNYGKTETIDYIMQVATLYPGHQAVLVGNVIKYISRAPLKGDKEKDLKKAQWYLNKLIEAL